MSRYLKLFYAILIGLFIFTAFRIGILVVYYNLFQENSMGSIIIACIHGIRFDASIFLTVIAPFIILLILPVNNRLYEKIIYWALYVIYSIIIIYLIIDAVYFGYVSRHLAGELALLGNDKKYIITMAKEYLPAVIILLLCLTVLAFLNMQAIFYLYL